MDLNFNDIRTKDIINISDGKIIGRAVDIIFDQVTTSVKGFSVPIIKKGFSLKKPETKFIRIQDVVKIGSDVILVKFDQNLNLNSEYVPKVFKRATRRA